MEKPDEEKLGKREKPENDEDAPVSKDNVKKSLKDLDPTFVPKKSDFDPLDDVILDDGEVSSEHSSYNEENFDKEDFMNFVRRNMSKKNDGLVDEEEEDDFEDQEEEQLEEEEEEEGLESETENKKSAE